MPLIIAVSIVLGIVLGTFFSDRFSGNRLNIINTSSNKLNDLLHIIDDQYVDTVDIGNIVEQAMPKILAELDPHCSYISAEEAKTVNDELRGSFSGVGIQFQIKQDTVYVSSVIKGGPAEKVGMHAGDRIISIDGEPYVGKDVTNTTTLHRLKGEQGSKVRLGVVRRGEADTLSFTITRGDIPVKSIEASYMLTPTLGYININKFGETTYPELLIALAQLKQEGFKGLVIDLRGNTGGYLKSAIQMVNEFLPADKLIVYTQGRKEPRQDYKSDGRGSYKQLPLIVLTDEGTASAAEIFAGAIQDNDRGIVVGRRSFGKGLVQQPIEFHDGSLIHLTVSRYYTPSGRCIQKPYTSGEDKEYEYDILNRYQHGEFFNEDSIRQSGQVYTTSIGREVYGGGGIMPDYFVAEDTTMYTSYYQEAASRGLISQFCFNFTDNNRPRYAHLQTTDEILRQLRHDRVINQFIDFCDSQGLRRRNNMILRSQPLLELVIHGNIIYNYLDMEEYLKFINQSDRTIQRAIELYDAGATTPTLDASPETADKKTASIATHPAFSLGIYA